jgi:hypothetical protein
MNLSFAARVGALMVALALASAWVMTSASVAAQWSTPSKVTGVKRLQAVSCVSRSFCMAVGGRKAVAYRSGAWGRAQTIDSRYALVTVSCASATFCVAGDGFSEVFMYNGTRWSSATLIATPINSGCPSCSPLNFGLSELSCGGRRFCGAVGVVGYASFYDGSRWSEPRRIPGAFELGLISCPVAGFCMAMDLFNAFRLSGGSWHGAGSVSPSNPQGGSEQRGERVLLGPPVLRGAGQLR